MNLHKSLALFVLFLIIFGCFSFLRPAKAQFSGNFGAIVATVKWGVQIPKYSAPTFKLKFVGNTTNFTLEKFDSPNSIGSFNTGFSLPPDTYTVTAYRYQIGVPDNEGTFLGNQTVSVPAEQAVSVNFDLSEMTGLVQGDLVINGSAASGYIQFCGPSQTDPCGVDFDINNNPFNSANGPWNGFGSNGFSIPVLPGNYRAHVITENRASIGIVPVTVVAGQIIANSNLRFSINFGSISGTVKWGTENLKYSLSNSPMFSVKFVGNNSGFVLWKRDSFPSLGSFNTGSTLPPDTYTVSLYKYQAFAPDSAGTFLGSQTVSVGSGQAVSSNFDLEGSTGLVKGSITINGTAASGYIQFCGPLQTDSCLADTNINNPPFNFSNGSWNGFDVDGFSVPVVPGNYRAHVITSSRSEVGTVSIIIEAGQVNVAPAFSINNGSISGTIMWKTETPSAPFKVRFVGNTTGYNLLATTSSGSVNTGFVLPPDTYEVTVYKNQYGLPDSLGPVLLSREVVVESGQSAVVGFDLSETTGLVKGNLYINGLMAGGHIQFCGLSQADSCLANVDINNPPFDINSGPWEPFNTIGVNNSFVDQGGFKVAVAPGNYRLHVITLDRAEINIVPITVIAGVMNDVVVNPVSILSIETTFLPVTTVGASYSQALQATGGSTPLTWSISFGSLPAGLNIDSQTGAISGTPTAAGTYDFTIRVTDANSQMTTQDLTIVVNPIPVIDTVVLPDATVSASYSQTIEASGGMTPLSWSISSGGLPEGFSIDSSTGMISGTASASGTSVFTVQVTDASGISASQELSLAVNDVPAITMEILATGTVGMVYSQLIGVSGGSAPLVWSVSSGSLPEGLNLNDSTGEILGTPISVGSSDFVVEVSDANGVTTNRSMSITIIPAVSITTSSNLVDATLGVVYSQIISASGGTSPLVWSIFSGSLPDGLLLDSSTGTISGTPAAVGTFNFTIGVTDANNQSATQAQSITVNPVPIITTVSMVDATVSGAYLQTVIASGGTAPLTWSIIGGSLPSGLSLNSSTGEISGMPSIAGTFSFTIQVSDAYSVTASQNLTITVNAAPRIVRTNLPDKKVNKHYSQSVIVSGGSAPLVWSVVSGSLPTGLALDSVGGVISGIPTIVGVYSFTIEVIDANAVKDTQSYTIEIKP